MAKTDTHDHGRQATGPTRLPRHAWREILTRAWGKMGNDNISLMAAGVAFYGFLSIVPLMGALVMTYGLIADPSTIASNMQTIIQVVPREAAKLILDQLVNLVTTASGKKGLGLAVALLISLYGATRASGAMIMALNVVYEQRERRNFIWTTILSFLLIIGAVLVGVMGILSASAIALVSRLAEGLGPVIGFAISATTWVIAGVLASFAIAATYRLAPDRADARWRWLTMGSALATLLWLIATLGFGAYAATLGNYNATYGSLGAVVVLLMWLFVSAYAILLGAVINAETERQVTIDTTTGRPRPMGQRGATMADEVAPPA